MPEMKVRGCFESREVADVAEYQLIETYRACGARLCNILGGGTGGRSSAVKAMWRDPEYVAKQKAGVLQPESRARRSASGRKVWTDVAYRAYMTALQNRPEIQEARRQRVSAQSRNQWGNPDFKARMMAKMRSLPKKPGTSSSRKNISYNSHRKSWCCYYDEGGKRILTRWSKTEQGAIEKLEKFLAERPSMNA